MNKYQQAKERVRQKAIDWQLTFSDNVYYWFGTLIPRKTTKIYAIRG